MEDFRIGEDKNILYYIDIASQIFVLLTGISAIYLVGRTDEIKKYGPVIALIGQPAWFSTFIINEQWFMILVSFIYTYLWALAFYNHWFGGNSINNN